MTAKENASAPEATKPPYKTKQHAVELALKKLGWNAKPAKVHDHLLKRFNLDMTPAHIGVCKTTILRRKGMLPEKGEGSAKSARKVLNKGKVGRPRKSSAQGASFTTDDILIVRGLLGSYDHKAVTAVAAAVSQIGADKFLTLVDAVG